MQKSENKELVVAIPKTWSHPYNEVKEVKLSPTTTEYRRVEAKLSGEPLKHLKEITRVQDLYMYNRYKLRELEYKALGIPVTERCLVHATGKSNVPSILQNNLDWRLVKRAKFGQGVSFSACAQYANKECARANGDNRAMIITKVLVGKQHPGSCTTKLPKKGFDTTFGRGDNVIVKYYDDEFYPAYVAYYDLPNVKHNHYHDYDDYDVFFEDYPYDDDLEIFFDDSRDDYLF